VREVRDEPIEPCTQRKTGTEELEEHDAHETCDSNEQRVSMEEGDAKQREPEDHELEGNRVYA
jgi:hypothetical protein